MSYFGGRRENTASSHWNPTFAGSADDSCRRPGNGASCFSLRIASVGIDLEPLDGAIVLTPCEEIA
jgi:hypothetical protein